MKLIKKICFAALVAALVASAAAAQTENPPARVEEMKKEAVVAPSPTPAPAPETSPTPIASVEVKDATTDEIVPYYNNYLKEYRLGPNDVITVEVFGQCPDYCKTGITVPPTARISYPLIREGVMVGGKTVEQIADEITKKLDEYIIDPKVTVTLDKAMSVRYSVMGKVAAPGIRIMDRKVSVYEAIIEAGGLTKEGDKKKVAIVSFDNQGRLTRRSRRRLPVRHRRHRFRAAGSPLQAGAGQRGRCGGRQLRGPVRRGRARVARRRVRPGREPEEPRLGPAAPEVVRRRGRAAAARRRADLRWPPRRRGGPGVPGDRRARRGRHE